MAEASKASVAPNEVVEAKLKANKARQAHLEAFRAEKAAKRAASLGLKAVEAEQLPPKLPRAKPPALKFASQQKDPNKRSAAPKSAVRSNTEEPSLPPVPAKLDTPKTTPRSSNKGPEVENKAAVRKVADTPTPRIFGYETSKELVSSEEETVNKQPQPEAASTAPSCPLGPTFSDSTEPQTGIKWHIQMEKLRLQQWRVLNARTQASLEKQEKLAEAQLLQATQAVLAIKQASLEKQTQQRNELHSRQVAEVLAAQIPRLELYSSMKDDHEASLAQTSGAVAAVMQQMPLVNGAVCGDQPEVVDAEGLLKTLQGLDQVMQGFMPHIHSFNPSQGPEPVQAKPGFCMTASAAKTLAEENEELQSYLIANAQLLKTLEREVLHAESLAVQQLQAEQVC